MQRFLTLALALCLGLTFSLDADARRFGGGKSFGGGMKHRQTQQQQQKPAAQPNKQAPAAGAKPALGGIGGMLMGMAAGGLLASMFMGGAFEGLQIMDILIFGLIAFVIFKLIASRRRSMPQAATAGAPAMQREAYNPSQNIFAGSATAAAAAAAKPVINAPAWFNESNFLQAAESHFNALQQHWDANEMEHIAEFVTPEMLTFLSNERSSLGDAMQSTYIDNLSVQLDGIDEEADMTVATLTFHGIAKTSRFDQGEAFSESWRMERQHGDNQPWLIAGIRQNA